MEPQVLNLPRSESKHEIFRKPIQISLYCLIQHLCFNSVKLCQIRIQHNFVPADQQD